MANNLNRTEYSIRMKAFKLNLTKKYSFWTEEEIEYLKNNYKYRNKEELAKNLDRTWYAIQIKASELNLTGISIDEDFFKNWTKKMAWTLGLWIADGNIYEKNNSVSFASSDYNLLEIVKTNLNSDHKIGKNRKKNSFQLRASNEILYNDLLKHGGTPRKSLTIQFPEVPDEFLPHFIRGYLDGDGSNFISKYGYLRSSFAGNVDFLTVLKNKIKEQAGIETGKLYLIDKNCNPRMRHLVYRSKNAIALCDYIYQESENLRLERKFEIYDQMKKEYLKKLKK